MHRLVPTVSLTALGLSALLSSACGFQGRGPDIICNIQSGSATVSSPTGYFGPPDISGVNRAYNLSGSCDVRTSDGDILTGEVWTVTNLYVYDEYHPGEHEAREEIRGTGLNVRSEWSCDLDPWVAPDAHCTRQSFEGVYPPVAKRIIDASQAAPVSAGYLTGDARQNVLLRLIADYKDKAALFPNPCFGDAEYTSLVLLPSEGQQITSPSSVPLNVKRGAADGCTAALDGVDPVFDVEWEYADASGTYTIAPPIVASFDARVSTHAIQIPFAAFAPYTTPQAVGTWRVRARLSLQPNAVWSDWVNFTLVGVPQS
ncbi:MAG TPA: hypothetical protein VKV26_05670 [Dehalococcoidia bacterium]|nr:hypothetical protein [Dehalococcoidia bacterium]